MPWRRFVSWSLRSTLRSTASEAVRLRTGQAASLRSSLDGTGQAEAVALISLTLRG
jgi:hypothetical protein